MVTEPSAGRGAGSAQDIEEFYAAHVRNLTVQLYAYTGDLSVAQDLVQEAFCRAIPRWSTVGAYDDPLAWLRPVALNLAASRWRRMRTAVAFVGRHREEHVAEPSPDRVALATALQSLPPKHRRAVVLFHLADLSIADIAASEAVPEATIRVWLHRGRTALAALLAEQSMKPTGKERRDA